MSLEKAISVDFSKDAYMQFEKIKFYADIRMLVTEVLRVGLECGQFPTMKIPLSYDSRYQLPNLFL